MTIEDILDGIDMEKIKVRAPEAATTPAMPLEKVMRNEYPVSINSTCYGTAPAPALPQEMTTMWNESVSSNLRRLEGIVSEMKQDMTEEIRSLKDLVMRSRSPTSPTRSEKAKLAGKSGEWECSAPTCHKRAGNQGAITTHMRFCEEYKKYSK